MRALLTVAWLVAAAFLTWHAITFKASAIEHDILTRSAKAVKALDTDAEVFADGRFVTIRGQAPSETAKATLLATANAVWGILGPYDEMVVSAAPKSAAIVLAEKIAGGALRLSGTVPSDKARTAVEKAAEAAFPGIVENRLIAAEAETMPTGNLDQAFQALAALDAGTLLVNSGQVTISGRADDPAKAAVARDLAAAHSDTWNVFLDGQATGARFGAVKLPDGSILTSGDIPSEKMRETLLDLLRGGDAELRVTDRLNIHAEGLAEAWVENLMKGAKALAKLDWGSVSLDGDKAYLTGMADADQIGPISDDLGVDFTAELTPRSAKSAPGRISTLERELEAAKSRVLDLSAASAKHLADLNAADARADQLRKAGADADAEAQAAKDRISELEAAATKNQADLANANARIAGLTEMLSLRPADADDLHPADALPGPSRSSLEATGPTRQADAQRSQPAATDVPHEPTQEQTPPASAQAMPQAAPTDQPQQEAVRTAALSASQEAEHIAETCNAAINSMLKNAAITFESKSAQITREGNEVLDRLMAQAAPCVGNPALKVTVGGHTDSRGQDRDNLRLSKERADSVKESLIVRSIPPDAITAIGYGETMPIADNETEEGRSVNRRITIDWSLR